MSDLRDHFREDTRSLPKAFYQVPTQVLRTLLRALEQAVASTVAVFGESRLREPQFTRQLAAELESVRDSTPGTPRYSVSHQAELPIMNDSGVVLRYRLLDIHILFARQLGRRGDYLCLECKYLETTDRQTDAQYVAEGVDRIVSGEYAAGHPWAVMAGLERVGPLELSAAHVCHRLIERYGPDGGFKVEPMIRLEHVYESKHPQADGSHHITIVHAFFLITV